MCDSDYDEGKGLSPKAGVAIVIAFLICIFFGAFLLNRFDTNAEYFDWENAIPGEDYQVPEVVGFGDGSFELYFACDECVRKDFFDVYDMATSFTFVYDEEQSSDSELVFGNDHELHMELRIHGSKGDGDLPYIELRSIEGEHIIRMTFRSNPTDEMFRLEDGSVIPRLMVKAVQHVIEMTWSYEQSVYAYLFDELGPFANSAGVEIRLD